MGVKEHYTYQSLIKLFDRVVLFLFDKSLKTHYKIIKDYLFSIIYKVDMDITFIIQTFKRQECLDKLLESVKLYYPNIPVIIYDDSINDMGLSWGRNYLVSQVKTKYFLLLDDDFVFTKKTKIETLYKRAKKGYDVVAGSIVENGLKKHYEGRYTFEDGCLTYIPCSKKPFDFVFNFFVGKTSKFKECKWDEELKLAEHTAFFFKNKGRLKIDYIESVEVDHHPVRHLEYIHYRKRAKYYFKIWAEKNNIQQVVDYNGIRSNVLSLFVNNINVNTEDIQKQNAKSKLGKVDFLIKTFMRYDSLEKLLFSIAKYYPNANIYIADDGNKFNKKYYLDLYKRLFDAGLQNKPSVFNLGFDIGLAAARNHLIENSYNEYKLILDDDFIFTAETKIEKFIEVLDENKDIGVVGGALRQDGNIRNYEGWLEIEDKTLVYKPLDYENLKKINYCDIVFNFALFRNDMFNSVKWDPAFKISAEHTDFYLRAKKTKWKVAYLPEVVVEHKQNLTNPDYKKMRARSQFYRHLFEKYNINKIISFNGLVYTKDGPAITKSHL